MRRDNLRRVQIESSNLETQQLSEITMGLAQWKTAEACKTSAMTNSYLFFVIAIGGRVRDVLAERD